MSEKELGHKTKVLRIEIAGVAAGDWQETRTRWRQLADAATRIVNDVWSHWQSEHFAAGNHRVVRAYMAELTGWHKADKETRGPKPKCAVKCLPNEMQSKIYKEVSRDHVGVNTRSVVLALHKIGRKMANTPGSNSAWPRWMKILAGEGEYPSSSRPLPVPFDATKGKLIAPVDEKKDPWILELRVDRIPRPGMKTATSTLDRIRLRTGGSKLRGIRSALWQIALGKWKFCGSDLVLRQSKGKWYLHVCYQFPEEEKPALDTNRAAYLTPSSKLPVLLWIGERRRHLLRFGQDVKHVRRQLLTQRWSRQEAYRNASSNRKGHGRKRAIGWMERFQRRWQDFVKTWNGQLAADVVKELVASGFGRLIYYQPVEDRRDTRALARLGKVAGRPDGSGWDWAQMGAMLAAECAEKGIAMETVKCGRRVFSRASEPEVKRPQRVMVGAV